MGLRRLFLFALTLLSAALPGRPQHLLLWDSEASQNTCTWHYGAMDSTSAQSGTWCFRGTPDQWHRPGIHLGCQPTWRADISHLDVLRFYARTDLPGATFKLRINGWPWTSRELAVNPYVDGGAVDTSWRQVTVPLDSLRTPDYSLNTVEILYFGLAEPLASHHIFIDDVWALDLEALGVKGLATLSNTVLRLDLSGRPDTAAVRNGDHYTILSTDDPRFVTGQSPARVGYRSVAVDMQSGAIPTVDHHLYLLLADSLSSSCHYTLRVDHLPDPAGNDLFQPWQADVPDPLAGCNGSVKCNQVGYLPFGPKFGYVGNYLGDAGPMPLAPCSYHLRSLPSGDIVHSGTPTLRGEDLVLSGEVVWDCDFSGFTTAGRYVLEVPGVGRSHPFTIGDDVYQEVARTAGRGFFFQRCGTGLDAAQVEGPWTHAPCHLGDGVVHACHAESPLYGGEVLGSTTPATRGWHDAGDYGKYVPTAAVALHTLFTIWELAPHRFADGSWNLPESGNGVPDLLDEIKWELDWLRGMQAADGGVFFKVTTTAWADDMPEADVDTRWLSPKTTHSTGQFAAIMAAAGRILQPWWPAYADSCLAQAKLAWAFLDAHPDTEPPNGFVNPAGIGGGAYTDPLGDMDERAWAAAELYKTTGDSLYHQAFASWWPLHPPTWGWNDFQHSQQKASWAYATTSSTTRQDWVDQIGIDMRSDMDRKHLPRTWQNIYRNANRVDVLDWIAWGTFAHSSNYSLDLIKTMELLNIPDYLDEALVNLDSQLGANPLGTSFISGVGAVSPLDPLHRPSLSDGHTAPVPGIPVFGPVAHMPMSNAYYQQAQAQENLYPSGLYSDHPYPILRRYYDIAELVMMSEFTITDMAVCTAVFGYFGGESWQGRKAGFLAETVAGLAPLRVQFRNHSVTAGLEPGQWVWDFGDGTTSMEREPVHIYDEAGSYSPCLTMLGADQAADSLRREGLIRVLSAHPLLDVLWTAQGAELHWEALPAGAVVDVWRSPSPTGEYERVASTTADHWVDANSSTAAFYRIVTRLH